MKCRLQAQNNRFLLSMESSEGEAPTPTEAINTTPLWGEDRSKSRNKYDASTGHMQQWENRAYSENQIKALLQK